MDELEKEIERAIELTRLLGREKSWFDIGVQAGLNWALETIKARRGKK